MQRTNTIRNAKSTAAVFAAVALSLGLSACATNKGTNPTLNSIKQPIVEQQVFALDLATGYDGLAPTEQQRLGQWLETMGLRYGDKIGLDGLDANPRVADDIARQVARFGLQLTDAVPVTAGRIAPGNVRVVVSRSVAHVPGCPDWSNHYSSNLANRTTENFGCAVNSNLAAMVANPEHLLAGQGNDSQTTAMTASKAIDSYRTAPPTGAAPLKAVTTNEGGSE